VAPHVLELSLDGTGGGDVVVADGGPIPAMGMPLLVSAGGPDGFAVGTTSDISPGPGGATLVTFTPADLTVAVAVADVRSTVELPRNAAGVELGDGTVDPACLAGSADLDVTRRLTADVAVDGRLRFDAAAGTYQVGAVVSASSNLTAIMSAAARTEGRGPAGAGWTALALVAGAVLPVQGAVNARLRPELGSAPAVAAVSFVVATVAMALVLAVAVPLAGAPAPDLRRLPAVPWWGWLGGVAGAVYVTSVFLAIPRVGAASTVALTVAGQQLAGVAADRWGLLRLPRRPVTGVRLGGVGVLLAGVAVLQLA